MKKKKLTIFILTIITVTIVSFATLWFQKKSEDYIWINDDLLKVELAETKEERVRGLSNKTSLDSARGMLFVYDKPRFVGVWMKDMNFPIDIIWLSSKKEIITYKKNVAPSTYPEAFKPKKPAQYVLETKAGFIDKHAIKIGDKLNFVIDEKSYSK